MPEVVDYQTALDEVYRTFMAVKDEVKGFYDREIRRPERVVGLAMRLGILPPTDKIVRITGSKGKGTTTRAVAGFLRAAYPDKKIGLFVSPEEVDHNDRMRVNGAAMSKADFVSALQFLKPHLDELEKSLPKPEYISPFGIFLLIALVWFKEQKVEYYVLEGGRGAKFDEVGHLKSKISVVTSVFLEHPDKLGPKLKDVAEDKFSVLSNSEIVYASEQAALVAKDFQLNGSDKVIPVPSTRAAGMLPVWLVDDLCIARLAAATLVDRDVNSLPTIDGGKISAAFLMGHRGDYDFAIEGVINRDSIDDRLIDEWKRECASVLAVCSFPDDKDRERLIDYFRNKGIPCIEVVLEGTRGYLHYERAIRDATTEKITCMYDDYSGFAAAIDALTLKVAPKFVYFAGTQTYVRLARAALLPELELAS